GLQSLEAFQLATRLHMSGFRIELIGPAQLGERTEIGEGGVARGARSRHRKQSRTVRDLDADALKRARRTPFGGFGSQPLRTRMREALGRDSFLRSAHTQEPCQWKTHQFSPPNFWVSAASCCHDSSAAIRPVMFCVRNRSISSALARAASTSGFAPWRYAPISMRSFELRLAARTLRRATAFVRCSEVVILETTRDTEPRTSTAGK